MSVVCALGFALWCWLIQWVLPPSERGSDFRAFYTAAAAPPDRVYDLAWFRQYQEDLGRRYGRADFQPFPRPPLYAAALRPLAALSYPQALYVWLGLLSATFLGAAWLIRDLYGGDSKILAALVSFYPVSFSLTIGQDSALVLAALLLAMRFHRRGRHWPAALFLSLAFQKFHLLLLVPLALVLFRKWPLLGRFGAWSALGALLNLALLGRSGLEQYRQVLAAGVVDRMVERAWNLRNVAAQLGWGGLGFAALALLLVGWFLWLSRRLEFEEAFWLSVTFSIVLAWHSLKYDYVLALPLLLLLWVRHRLWLAAALLFGGLWAHALAPERLAWLIPLLVAAMSLELWGTYHRRLLIGTGTGTLADKVPA